MTSPTGPNSGTTPSDDSDLNNTGNPYSNGERWGSVSSVETSAYPSGGVPGYYSPPGVPGSGNPNADGTLDGGFESVPDGDPFGRVLGNGIAPDAASPTTADYQEDGAFGRDGNSRSV